MKMYFGAEGVPDGAWPAGDFMSDAATRTIATAASVVVKSRRSRFFMFHLSTNWSRPESKYIEPYRKERIISWKQKGKQYKASRRLGQKIDDGQYGQTPKCSEAVG
jgi:hypothetical protein